MIKRLMVLAFGLIVLFAAAPFISALIASGLAHGFVCGLDEGSAHVCMVAGVDIGGVLHAMFTLLWFAILTVPLAVVALSVWLVAAIVLYVMYRRRQTF
jgi:hypothetical protein